MANFYGTKVHSNAEEQPRPSATAVDFSGQHSTSHANCIRIPIVFYHFKLIMLGMQHSSACLPVLNCVQVLQTAHQFVVVMYVTVSQEPTGAATITEMEAIVVSKETIKGANDINAWRQQHGSSQLMIVTVDLVGSQGSSNASKLSSTRLRNEEAQRSDRNHAAHC